MKYEVTRDRLMCFEWRVEARDPQGKIYRAIFTGPDAEKRALNYCRWINSQPEELGEG